MKRLGQHFLVNRAITKRIIAALALKPDDTVIEIGPGKGALTIPLAAASREVGCRVVAIEKDSLLVEKLRSLEVLKSKNLEIIEDDALKILPDLVWKLGIRNWKLTGNIPYYITGKLLRILSELERKPEIAVLMLQREVAERIAATPPSMNLLAAATQIWATPHIIARLKPEDFSPPPKVESAVIKLTTKQISNYQFPITNPEKSRGDLGVPLRDYYRLIKALFKQPRKTIWNNLRAGFPEKTEALRQILKTYGLSGDERPQDVSLEVLINLSQRLG